MPKIFLILLWLFVNIARADDAADQLLALLKPVNNLSAVFEQQSLDKNGKVLQRQSGHFIVQKSGEFVWFVNPPYEQQIISDGKVIYIYDPDLEQLTIKPLDQKAQMIPLLLFSESGQQIIQQYAVTLRKTDVGMEFELLPRQGENLFDRLVMVFFANQSVYVPAQLEIIDSLKQITRVHFDKTVLNRPVDQKQFSFSAPAGVDVIDERR